MTTLEVKRLAQRKGWNIAEFARHAKISYPTAHALWHDTPQQFSRRILDRVALALGVRVSDLFGGDPDPAALEEERE